MGETAEEARQEALEAIKYYEGLIEKIDSTYKDVITTIKEKIKSLRLRITTIDSIENM